MSVTVKRLDEKDLSNAVPLLEKEGWSFTVEELERLRSLGGCVGAYDGETLVGFLSFVDLDPVRWIGNVVVTEDGRGKGVGAQLVQDALVDVAQAGLYSVEKAVTLYERLGFAPRGEAFLYRAETATPKRKNPNAQMIASTDGPQLVKLDRESSGMDRYPLLLKLVEAYPESVRVVRERNRIVGYGIAKTSEGLTELGPIVADTPQARDALIDALLGITPGPYEATVLGHSKDAIKALEERGFTRKFRVVPMFKGDPPKWKPNQLVTAAGLEKS